MKLVVGLGNPGKKYGKTRHNIGFKFLDNLLIKTQLSSWEQKEKFKSLVSLNNNIILLKPQTFMNSSGEAVSAISNFYKIESDNILVVHDDLDLILGEWKMQFGVGPKIHGGVNSIEEKLGTKDFWRIRIGIDNRQKEDRLPGDEYVLTNFLPNEVLKTEKIAESILKEIENWIYGR